VRSYRVELGEIDALLNLHPAVREAVVIARADVAGQQQLVAYVVPSNELPVTSNELHSNGDSSLVTRHSLLGDALRSFLQDKLPEYMVPSAFVVLDTLPRTPNGKVNRRALPVPDQSRLRPDALYVAPRTPEEEMLAAIWAQLLNLPRVGAHDNFFALGGHSLLATRLIARVRDIFQVELPLRSVFETPTIAALAVRVEELLIEKIESLSEDELEALL
jgi:acyl carrier protein